MRYYIYSQISDPNYVGIITILHHKASLRKIISEFRLSNHNNANKIIIDFGLVVSNRQMRFVECGLAGEGEISPNECSYITLSNDIVNQADQIIIENRERQ